MTELQDFTTCTVDTGQHCLCMAHRAEAPEWAVLDGKRVWPTRVEVGLAGYIWSWRTRDEDEP